MRRKLVYLVPFLFCTIGLLLITQPSLYERHITQTSKHLGQFWEYPYGKLVLDSWELTQKNPLFGIGVKEYRQVSETMREPQPHPHNVYLELQTETGIFGLCLLIVLYGTWLKSMWGNYPIMTSNALAVCIAATILIRIWPLAPSPSFYTSWNAIPLWLMVGWWYGHMSNLMHKKVQ